MKIRKKSWLNIALFWALLATPSYGAPGAAITTLPVHANGDIVVNTVTNKIYVAGDVGVTVIDGATNTFLTIPIPQVTNIVVNEATNKIYVTSRYVEYLNYDRIFFYIIDGLTNAVTKVENTHGASLTVADPLTNKIYGLLGASGVYVLDGVTNTQTLFDIHFGVLPGFSLSTLPVVNTITNTLYAAGHYYEPIYFPDYTTSKYVSTIAIIDGTSNGTVNGITNGVTKVDVPASIQAVAINPTTNKIYGVGAGIVVVLDGVMNAVTTITDLNVVGSSILGINSVTNKIYFPSGAGSIMVLDGATNATITLVDPNARTPLRVAVNQVTNKIYVSNYGSSNITVIDGATNAIATLLDPNSAGPYNMAVNPVTNKVYVSNFTSNNVTVIDGNVPTTGPPSCTLSNIAVGPPTKLTVAMQDSGSGLQNIKVLEDVNSSIDIPPFTPGTTASLLTTATKLDQSQRSNVGFLVTNMAGSFTSCDPVDFTLELEGSREQHVFRSLPASEHFVRIVNGTPGVHHMSFLVNGHSFSVPTLQNGETFVLDIGSAMIASTEQTASVRGAAKENNNVVMYASGSRGSSAYVLVGDASVR